MDRQEYEAKVAWLRRYRESMRRQRLLEELLAQRRAEAERVGPLLQPSPGAGPGGASAADKLPRAVERILAAEVELKEQIGACEAVRREVQAAIGTVTDSRHRDLLTRRYIMGQTFGQIAGAMQLHERWVYKLHREGVSHLVINFGQ